MSAAVRGGGAGCAPPGSASVTGLMYIHGFDKTYYFVT